MTEIQSHGYAPSFKGINNIIHIMTTKSPSQLVSSSKYYHKSKAEIQEQRKGYINNTTNRGGRGQKGRG